MSVEPIAVFLDRDGVINADRRDFVKSWDEFEFLPSSLEALAVLAQATLKIVIVTNQSGIARGLLSEATLQQMHERMIGKIREAGGRIDAIYFCPHGPDAICKCRKPAPGLFFEAARELSIDLSTAWAIGDSHRDVQAAQAAGVRSILLDRSWPDPTMTVDSRLEYLRAADLLEAVRIVLGARETGGHQVLTRSSA